MPTTVSKELSDELVLRLAIAPGLFHRGEQGEELWRGLTEVPLRALHRSVRAGMRTLETGCGGTTVIFAAKGARHTVVTPSSDEEVRVRELCKSEGVPMDDVNFLIGSSDSVLAGFDEPLDLMLIDGAHRYPFPQIDWHYGAANLKVGGELWLDDVPIPAVYSLFEFLKGEKEWELVTVHDDKVAQFRKVAEVPADATKDWELQRYNRPWRFVFKHIPWSRRWRYGRQRVMLRSRIRTWRNESR
jgi:hypothetical protein